MSDKKVGAYERRVSDASNHSHMKYNMTVAEGIIKAAQSLGPELRVASDFDMDAAAVPSMSVVCGNGPGVVSVRAAQVT